MRAEKKQLVQDIRALIESSSNLFLISYKGLTAADFRDLRKVLAGHQGACHVVPNRIFSIAALESGQKDLGEAEVKLDTALVTGGSDPVAIAKALRDFGKTHPAAALKIALVEGKVCGAVEAAALADLPPREVLQAQLLGLLQAGPAQLVRVLNAKVASVVYALNAYLSRKDNAA